MTRKGWGRGALGVAAYALLLFVAFRVDRCVYLDVAGPVAEETGDRTWRFGRPEGGSSPLLSGPLGLFQRMGEIWFVVVITGTMLLVAPERRGQAVALFLAVVVTVAVGQMGLKHAIGKLRPAAELAPADVERLVQGGGEMIMVHGRVYNKGSALFRPPFPWRHAGLSLPSGHTALAFACFAVLARCFPRARWWFLLLACGVGASRVLMGDHFLSDVVAGAGVGYACARLVLAVPRVRLLVAVTT